MKTIPDDLSGVWITEIAEDCDIANTELQVNDVIVSVQGEAVNDYDSLNAAIAGALKGGAQTMRHAAAGISPTEHSNNSPSSAS